MANETMTLDKLQRWLSDKSSDEKENYSSHQFAYNTVWHFIEDNRSALEASMKGEVGQRKCSGCDDTIYDQDYCDNCQRLLES